MGKLIMWNLMTLDGLFEGEGHDLSWHEDVWGPELEALSIETKEAGALIFGRVTYEMMASHWPSASGEIADFMNAARKIVFSRTLKEAAWSNSLLMRDNAAEEVARLKRESERGVFLFGSANLAATLIRAGSFDEFRIALCPFALGKGTPLFKDRVKLNLIETRSLSNGVVILRYEPTR